MDNRLNALVLVDAPSNLIKITPIVEQLDLQTTQVMIEAKFIETTKNPKKDLGINWTDTLLNHSVSIGQSVVQFHQFGRGRLPAAQAAAAVPQPRDHRRT